MKIKGFILYTIFIFSACVLNPPSTGDILEKVNPFIGTGFHGHTYPGPTMPHGRIQLSPDTHIMGWDASSGYHYADSTLYGFSHTHLSGTGIGDLGDVLFLPYTDHQGMEKPVAQLNHTQETAVPGYYSIVVEPWNIKAELTTEDWCAWHKYTYPLESNARLMVDLDHILQPNWGHRIIDSHIESVDAYSIKGYRVTKGWANYDPIWFHVEFSEPISTMDIVNYSSTDSVRSVAAHLDFGELAKPLICRVALSSVDENGAKNNLDFRSEDSFKSAKSGNQKKWRGILQSIQIMTQDTAIQQNFYSALYHCHMAPILKSDIDGRYRGMDQQIHQRDHPTYTVYSLWDVYRSWFPLMSIIHPESMQQWIIDLYTIYKEGGVLPKWPLNSNYTGTMVGYPAAAVLADGIVKGIVDSLHEELVEAMVHSSQWQEEFYQLHKGTRAEQVMHPAIKYKNQYGIVPQDSVNASVSYALEMAYYDWCIAQAAKVIGDQEIAEQYAEMGQYYSKYFDSELQFMRGVHLDGGFAEGFNPNHSDHDFSPFIEGNSWQWTPTVPHDGVGFATLMGGPKALGDWLDELFTTDAELEGENISADITGLIGQYAHGNEPSHHVPYLYYYTDRPWRAQEVLDTILYHFYQPRPEGIIGNEDCGQMSAWYVLNALGLYQLAPGNPTFHIGRPIVDQAILTTENAHLKIQVYNQSKSNKYVVKSAYNGHELPQNTISYEEIVQGGLLEIWMSPDRPD